MEREKEREKEGDFRLSTANDATMLDVGERDRPPGDPPDGNGSWVKKVTGGSVGGRPPLDTVLNEEFVAERVTLEFPDGEDGEPVITIGKEVLDVMNGLWRQCIIVKVLGRHITIPALDKRLRELWKPKGGMYVIDLPRQFFMIRFDLKDEYLEALTGGPWRVFGSHLVVQAWSPAFNPSRDSITTTPVWVRLSNIPVTYYHPNILMAVARGLGKPIKVDLTTLHVERARFARVCVEVDLSKPLKGTLMVNGERHFVAYEGLMNICSGCGIYGHLVHNCPKTRVEKVVEKPVSRMASAENLHGGDGFTVVRRGARKAVQPENRPVVAAVAVVGSEGDHGRKLREITASANMEILPTSNRFSNLEEDMIESEIREVAITVEKNKENMVFTQQVKKGKSDTQGKQWVPVGTHVKKKSGDNDRWIKSGQGIPRGTDKPASMESPTLGLFEEQRTDDEGLQRDPTGLVAVGPAA